MPKHNTDGIINKLVIVFAISCLPAAVRQGSCSLDRFVIAYTATAPVPAIKFCIPRLVTCSRSTLYRDTRIAHKICTWTAKTTPCFSLSGCLPGLYPKKIFCSKPSLAQQHLLIFLPGR